MPSVAQAASNGTPGYRYYAPTGTSVQPLFFVPRNAASYRVAVTFAPNVSNFVAVTATLLLFAINPRRSR